jgi:hypothetical protein
MKADCILSVDMKSLDRIEGLNNAYSDTLLIASKKSQVRYDHCRRTRFLVPLFITTVAGVQVISKLFASNLFAIYSQITSPLLIQSSKAPL